MNQLKGHITNLKSFEGLILLEIEVADTVIKSIIIDDTDKTAFSVGKTVNILFKETELIISKENTELISLQNQFNCTIVSIKKGELLSQIKLKFKKIELNSIITTDSVDKLKLTIRDQVTALVKTNEIMVSVC